MSTHSTILAWKIPWTEDPGELYSPWDFRESNTTERLTTTTTNPMRSLKKWELNACVQSAILNWKIYAFEGFDTYN